MDMKKRKEKETTNIKNKILKMQYMFVIKKNLHNILFLKIICNRSQSVILNNNNKSRNDIRQANEATNINQNTMNKTKPNDYESY